MTELLSQSKIISGTISTSSECKQKTKIGAMSQILIGIDPGVKCGFATWDPEKRELNPKTLTIWELHDELKNWDPESVHLVIEDARKRGGPSRRASGAFWLRTLTKQIVELCESLGLSYELIRPGSTETKSNPYFFQRITGLKAVTKGGKVIISEHARDAALMVFGRSK